MLFEIVPGIWQIRDATRAYLHAVTRKNDDAIESSLRVVKIFASVLAIFAALITVAFIWPTAGTQWLRTYWPAFGFAIIVVVGSWVELDILTRYRDKVALELNYGKLRSRFVRRVDQSFGMVMTAEVMDLVRGPRGSYYRRGLARFLSDPAVVEWDKATRYWYSAVEAAKIESCYLVNAYVINEAKRTLEELGITPDKKRFDKLHRTAKNNRDTSIKRAQELARRADPM